MSPTRDVRPLFVVGLALVAMVAKLAIAYNTIGTNDTALFHAFARALSEHNLEWVYAHSRYFNHPPLTAYFLRGIFALTEQHWCQNLGLHFPFLLRLPGILADFGAVAILLQMTKLGIRIPAWSLVLFALSPISLMVSGFHGNTDPVMVFFLVCAGWMCLRNQPAAAGIFFALSCQIKIVPLLLLPLFAIFWWTQCKSRSFLLAGAVTTVVLWAEPLLNFPVLFARNVLGYGSYWGIWGITYLIRCSGLSQVSRVSSFDLHPIQILVMSCLKLVIVFGAVWIAWRSRNARGQAFLESIACTWLVFFTFAPGMSPQYLVWPLPFILVLSSRLHAVLLGAGSIFLFAFYNITAGGLPWNVAMSTDASRELWVIWSLIPWSAFVIGSIVLWLQRKSESNGPFFSFAGAGSQQGEVMHEIRA